MKTSKKIVLIIAVLLVIGGSAIAITALNNVDFNLRKFGNMNQYSEKKYQYDNSEINQISIEDVNSNITITPSKENKVKIVTMENDNEYYSVNMTDDGKLTIVYKENKTWFEFFEFIFNYGEKKLTVEVPSHIYGEVSVKSTNGDIRLSALSIDKELTINLVNGGVSLINTVVANNIQLKTVNGEINTRDIITSGNLEAKTTNGHIEINDTISEQNIIINTVNGEVDFKGLQACDITLETVSGDITGTLIGDSEKYTVEAKTVNGDKDVPQSNDGEYKLKAKTTNGDIKIEFE